ncbi:type 1 glutamine amidotransferase domain-containing protein [Shimia ponticola]|uniref:type 1 glutamine amidotransferase domain-containing protein n=1 Tax=Shimia ponticola TaxID=2582893 RepID=UPI0011BE1B41|nr:type 1 glutamine amidotransferase domain-containing protein [Shimia ponticola]
MRKNILILLTSADMMGDTGKETGFHWEELSTPYWILRDAGHAITLASVRGGHPPADPSSADPDERPDSTDRFMNDPVAMEALKTTRNADDIDPSHYDAIYLPGGHGTMWDFAQSEDVARIISAVYAAGGVVASVCHGPAALLGAKKPDGRPLVEGLKVNAFTDAEERAVGLDDVVPFLLETELRKQGADYEHSGQFDAHVAVDTSGTGTLITGQNPASAKPLAMAFLAEIDHAQAQKVA